MPPKIDPFVAGSILASVAMAVGAYMMRPSGQNRWERRQEAENRKQQQQQIPQDQNYQQNPSYQQNPYQQNPYQQNPYQQNPYQQNYPNPQQYTNPYPDYSPPVPAQPTFHDTGEVFAKDPFERGPQESGEKWLDTDDSRWQRK
jgi:hypothetical protein